MSVNQHYVLVNVDDLCGVALDWAVASTRCDAKLLYNNKQLNAVISVDGVDTFFSPSSSWSDAGPLIENGKISLRCEGNGGWYAVTATGTKAFNTCDCFDAGGDTALEAAMRCYVKKFGFEAVKVPEVLIAEV